MLVEFSIVPLGAGESVSGQVARVIDLVDRSGLPYRVNPMGTVVEGDWDEVMALIRKCHEVVRSQGLRTLTTLRIDDRPGRGGRLEGKIASVERHLGRSVKR